jgi:glycerophosphoryl diester phosphodiesterase
MRWIFLLFVFSACSKFEYFPDEPLVLESTNVLAHRGGGNYNGLPNTFEAIVYGFEYYNGVEVDIQMSANGTLWLSHSSYIDGCGNWNGGCFNEVSDYEIVQIDSCSGAARKYTRLSDVYKYMKLNYPNKYISLDVKFFGYLI